MTNNDRLTIEVADWVSGQKSLLLPTAVHHHVRRLALDHLSGVLASSHGPVSEAVTAHARRMYPGSDATAVGAGRLSVLGAAVVNGTNGHGIESDEGYTPGSVHPTSVVFPAVFAVAQQHDLSAERILNASAIGMELACRIADAGHPATRNNHFHNTPIAGVIGATAAICALLDYDAVTTANALGIAGSHASGLFEFLGQSAEVKRYHPGKAARDGIVSADLAASGLTGPTTILEGTNGYFAAFAGNSGVDWRPETVRNGLGSEWVLLRTYVKPYPCCRHLHGAIDAVLLLNESQPINVSQIESIDIGTFAIASRHNGKSISAILDAQLSLPYTIAVALLTGNVTLNDFTETTWANPAVLALMEKVNIHIDEQADASYPKVGRPADITIRFKDGSKVNHRVEQPYGEPDNPMSDQDLEAKARNLVHPIIGEAHTSAFIESIWKFESLAFLDDVNSVLTSVEPAEPAHSN